MNNKIVMVFLMMLLGLCGFAQEKAFDPILDENVEVIPFQKDSVWNSTFMWYPGQLSAFFQQQCVKLSKNRCVNVGYPGKFYSCSKQAYFKKEILLKETKSIYWSSPKKTSLSVDGVIKDTPENRISLSAGKHTLLFSVKTKESLPCIIFSGCKEVENIKGWKVSTDSSFWTIPENFEKYNDPNSFPDNYKEIKAKIKPWQIQMIRNSTKISLDKVKIGKHGVILVDFYHLEMGRLEFYAKGQGTITVRVGESPEEALNTNEKLFEQYPFSPFKISNSDTLIQIPERALRYASIECDNEIEISLIKFNASLSTLNYKMQFDSDDCLINNLFDMAGASLHTSAHRFYLDGIKRDYLPWAMDATVSTFAGDYLFADQQLSKNGISIALMPRNPKISDLGVTDYPLHGLIGIWQNYKRYGDIETTIQYKDRIIQLVDFYSSITDENGFLHGETGSAGFIPGWSIKQGPHKYGVATYSQILLYRNYQIAANLFELWKEDDRSEEYKDKAERLKQAINNYLWDKERKVFVNGIGQNGQIDERISHHAQYWAILANIFPQEHIDNLFDNILPNIPYYYEDVSYEKGYEMLAYARANRIKDMWDYLFRVFGDWMEQGHTRFPENFSPSASREDQLKFYGRPFALSLCHGANGVPPVIGILNGLIGFRQSDDNLSEYTIQPNLLHLNRIDAKFPIKEGEITIKLRKEGESIITIPDNCSVTIVTKGMEKPLIIRKAGSYEFDY